MAMWRIPIWARGRGTSGKGTYGGSTSGRLREEIKAAGRSIRARIFAGLVVIVPVAVTVFVVRILFLFFDSWLQPIVSLTLGRSIPGVGLLATILLLYLAGFLATRLGGRTLIGWLETVLARVPVVGDVFGASKQIMETISNPTGFGFKRVVIFEYPRPGMRAIGFVTRELTTADGELHYAIFLPTTPNPTSGFLLLVPVADTMETGLTVDQALKMVVSGGVVIPPTFRPGNMRMQPTGPPPTPAAAPGPQPEA